MGDGTTQEQPLLSAQETEAIDIFFKSFGRVLVAAQMYFKDHPSYVLAVSELKDRFRELKAFRQELTVTFSADTTYLDDKPFMPTNGRYRDLAQRLHRLHIAGIRFCGEADAIAFAEFTQAIVHFDAQKSAGKTWDAIFTGFSGVEVKDLDYSRLFAGTGGCSADVWKTVFDADQAWTASSAETMADHIDEITDALTAAGADDRAAEKAVAGFERLAAESGQLREVKRRKVSQALYAFFSSSAAATARIGAGGESSEKIKAMLRENLDQDELIGGLLSSVQETRSVNTMFVDRKSVV